MPNWIKFAIRCKYFNILSQSPARSLGEMGKEDEEEEEMNDQLKSLHLASTNKLK